MKRTLKGLGISLLFIITSFLIAEITSQDGEICLNDGDIVCNEDCTQIIECVEDGDSYLHIPLEQCTEEKYCYPTAPDLTCQYHSACKDPSLIPFQCTSQAVFPDPYDCNKFYMCVGNEDGTELYATHVKCPDGIAYDYKHRYCNLHITEEGPPSCIDGPVPFCTALGQTGPLVEDDNIYYVCHRQDLTLFPVLYQCPAGGVYNPTSLGCDKEQV